MAFNIFKKPAVKKSKPKIVKADIPVVAKEPSVTLAKDSVVLHSYISEKATILEGTNKYVFKVSKYANKPEVKKNIEKSFSVKVLNVRMINMPSKTRRVGRHVGTKSGFRKAIVTLAEGNSINTSAA